MNNNFDATFNFFPEGTYLPLDYDDFAVGNQEVIPPNIDEINNKIDRLRALYQFTPDQFFSELASKINPDKTDILIPELKSLVGKIFLILDKAPKHFVTKEINDLVWYLLRIYAKGNFDIYKKHTIENIVTLFKKYLIFYLSTNSNRFNSDMHNLWRGFVYLPFENRNSLRIMNEWLFYYGTDAILRSSKSILRAILGENFLRNQRKYIIWEYSLISIVENWQSRLGFDGNTLGVFLELTRLSSESFIKWSRTSERYVFNEFLQSTFTSYFLYCPNIWEHFYAICDSLKLAEKWVEKGENTKPLLPLLIMLDVLSSEGFSASKNEFDFFFFALLQFYVWVVSRKCAESFPVKIPENDIDFFESTEVRQKIENSVMSLTAQEVDLLNLEFEKYGKTIKYFKELIHKDENDIPEKVSVPLRKFSDFIEFILRLFSNIQVQNEHSDLSHLMSSESLVSFFFP